MEDENGREINQAELGPALTGDPNAILILSGAKQHDIDLILSDPPPLPTTEITLSDDDVKLLGYFARDYRELADSELIKEGPGSVSAFYSSRHVYEKTFDRRTSLYAVCPSTG